MKSHGVTKSKTNPAELHRVLVDQIVREAAPARLTLRPWAQWCLWLVFSLVVMAFFWLRIGVQADLGQVLQTMPPLAFVVTAFLGASLAAWEAIASSVPGRQTSALYRVLAVVVILALFAIPFVFFSHPDHVNLLSSFWNGRGCAEVAGFSGLIPWIFIGSMLSRNASFNPVWTGLWSGASAFLMGTITIQIHCPGWDMAHVLMDHLLPAALGALAACLLGAFWFSAWKK